MYHTSLQAGMSKGRKAASGATVTTFQGMPATTAPHAQGSILCAHTSPAIMATDNASQSQLLLHLSMAAATASGNLWLILAKGPT